MKYIQISTTFDKKEEAEKIADLLLENKAAACIQISGPITSKYIWKGNIEKAQEFLCLIKTTEDKFEAVERIIKENHSYETPEIIAVPITLGSEEYLNWINKNTE